MKAVILARGRGTRMQRQDEAVELTPAQAAMADRGLKSMIPLPRPFLDYVLSALADAGCDDICLIVGPDDDVIRPYYANASLTRVRLSFAVQEEARGTADALLATEVFAEGQPFLVLNADNYYPAAALRALVELENAGLAVFRQSTLVRHGNIDADRVRTFAIVTVDADGVVRDIVEKPGPGEAIEADPLVSMNLWRFDRRIFDACRAIPPSPRGELELPNAVRFAVRSRQRFYAEQVEEGVLDLSRRADIPEVARRLSHVEPRP